MSQNGKGSAPRRQTKAERKRFEDNYDSIFKSRKKEPEAKQQVCEFCSLPKPCGCPGFDHQGWG